MVKAKIERKSNYELLRIIAMVLIIASHFAGHGGFEFSSDSITINRVWLRFITFGGKIGVNIFVLISGYFLITSDRIKTSKVFKLILQLVFYSVVIYLFFVWRGWAIWDIKTLIKCFMPITYYNWWFASVYFLLYLLSPFVNKLLTNISQKAYVGLLTLLTICWCFIPTVFNISYMSNELLWFVYLYAIAGYVRLYGLKSNRKASVYICWAIIVAILTLVIMVLFDWLGLKSYYFATRVSLLYGMQKLHVYAISFFIFVGFGKLNISHNKFINLLASSTFGVYLIHDNYYMRSLLWIAIFKNSMYEYSIMLILYTIGVVFVVFIIATIIELVRIYLFEKSYMRLVEKMSYWLDIKVEKMLDSIIE